MNFVALTAGAVKSAPCNGTQTCSPQEIQNSAVAAGGITPDTIALARFLIGKVVVREFAKERVSGRIVETEAYPPGDPAGHHFRGPTPRMIDVSGAGACVRIF